MIIISKKCDIYHRTNQRALVVYSCNTNSLIYLHKYKFKEDKECFAINVNKHHQWDVQK